MSNPDTTKNFKAAYAALNPAQKQAVDTLDGPVMVLAGPGTGKTQILATRIARILEQTDTPPSAILALTFTDSGVRAMRERLLLLIGTTAYYVQIYTFHSFCSDIIRNNPDYFLISPDPKPLTDLDRFQIVHSLIDSDHYQYLKPVNAPYHYVRAIIGNLQTLKREGVTPERFQTIIAKEELEYQQLLQLSKDKKNKISKTRLEEKAKLIGKNKELLKLYEHYQKALTDRGRFDFEDMINFVTATFSEHNSLLLTYQERLQYFLIDEYQDTNSAQNQVVELLAKFWGPKANIFVVGDPNQSVFRFQGASFENMLSFIANYPTSTIISLIENYRSTQNILDAAHKLITHNSSDTPLAKPAFVKLNSQTDSNPKITKAVFSSNFSEDYYLATTVRQLLDSGTDPSEIALIFRRNTDIQDLAAMLARLDIPYVIQGGGNVLDDPQINKLINILRVLATTLESQEGSNLFTILNYPFFDLDPLDILRLARAAAKQKISILDLLSKPGFNKLNLVSDPDKFLEFRQTLSDLQNFSLNHPFTEFLEHLVFRSGFLNYLENRPDTTDKLENLKVFFDFAFSLYRQNPNLTIKDLVSAIDLMRQNNLQLPKPDLSLSGGVVTLTTAHKAKGLEWEHVFIYKAIDGLWGNPSTRELLRLPQGILEFDTKDPQSKVVQNEEERRLFYVALTRAKKQATITYAHHYLDSNKQAVPSMFIFELPQDLVSTIDTASFETSAREFFSTFFAPTPQTTQTEKEAAYLRQIISEDFNLSASALTTYLECPYQFKLKNLIKVPEAPHPAVAFGSAVHKALELFYRQYKNSRHPPALNQLLSYFSTSLDREPLTKKDHSLRLKQGKDILTAYYNFHLDSFTPPLYLEKWFGGQLNPVFLEDISLVGKIDRIDPLDPKGRTVRLVDYKTGQVMSQNEVEGKTAANELKYRHQMVFYRLLTSLAKNFSHTVKEVELDFVEAPHKEARLAHRAIVVSEDDLQAMTALIKQTMAAIRDLQFPRTTDTRHCLRCSFRDHCWPEGLPTTKPTQLSLLQ